MEILPEVYELWELNELSVSSIKSTATNVKNRLSLVSESEEENFDLTGVTTSISAVRKGIENLAVKKDKLRDEINTKLSEELHLERLYSTDEEFLSTNDCPQRSDRAGGAE